MDFLNVSSSNNSCASQQLVIKEEIDLRTVVSIILTAIALTNNFLVMFLVFSTKQLRKNLNFYIVNMAVSDLITSLIICLKYTFSYFEEAHGIPMMNDISCKVFNYFRSVALMVSLLTLLAISIDRYRAVSRPLNVTKIPKPCFVFVVLLTWIIPGSVFVYEPLLSKHVPGTVHCNRIDVFFGGKENASFASCLVAFLFVCLVVINIQILRKLRQSTVTFQGLNEIERRKRIEKFRSAVKMVLCSLVLYILCTSPMICIRFLVPVLSQIYCKIDMSFVLFVIYNLLIINTGLGPVMYFIFLRDFREALKNRLRRVGTGIQQQQQQPSCPSTLKPGKSLGKINPVFAPID